MFKKCAFYSVAVILGFSAIVLPQAVTAEAYTTPTSLNSWYVSSDWYNNFKNPNNTYSAFYNFGYELAQSYPSGTVILDFGSLVDSNGTYELRDWLYSHPLTFSQVQSDVEDIIRGWEANSNNQSKNITLAIGTNSSGSSYANSIQQAMGTSFGNMIKSLDSATNNTLWIEGADDIETPWQIPEYPLSFLDGYDAASTGADILNFGWVKGDVTPSSSNNSAFDNQWTPGDVYLASYGKKYIYPGYELYDSNWARQYEDFDLWSYNWEGSSWSTWPLLMASTTAGQDMNPATAYSYMQNALNSNTHTATSITNLGNQQPVS